MSDEELRLVFKALADENRRRILDIVKASAGISVGGVAQYFDFTRFAVMKHLRILEEANLLRIEKDGRYRKIYLNAIPIQMIYDRWLSRYSRHWARGLTAMKYELENENDLDGADVKQVYVVYIRTSVERLWDTLIQSQITPEWFGGMTVRFEPKVGAPLTFERTEPDTGLTVLVRGEVLEIVPRQTLVYTFSMQRDEEVRADRVSRVRYDLEALRDNVKLTVTHDGFGGETASFRGTSQGWPIFLSNLKSYLETGRALDLPPNLEKDHCAD